MDDLAVVPAEVPVVVDHTSLPDELIHTPHTTIADEHTNTSTFFHRTEKSASDCNFTEFVIEKYFSEENRPTLEDTCDNILTEGIIEDLLFSELHYEDNRLNIDLFSESPNNDVSETPSNNKISTNDIPGPDDVVESQILDILSVTAKYNLSRECANAILRLLVKITVETQKRLPKDIRTLRPKKFHMK